MNILNQLSSQEIGRRLRIAREVAGVVQEQAASFLGVARTTIVAIEKGTRQIQLNEIQKLTNYYGISVNSLLRRESVFTDLIPRFRRLRDTNEKYSLEAVQLLNKLVKAEIELENILGVRIEQEYPNECGINSGNVLTLAEEHAIELRNWLGIGMGPISDIFAVIEFDLGIRLYQRRLDSRSKISGLFTYDQKIGACILLNANHPIERRIQSAAHELGHFIGTRQVPEVLEVGEKFLSREERYANAFGRSFLTPRETFTRSFKKLSEGASSLTHRIVILLANQYNISRQACVLRLEELGLIRKGSWDWFRENGSITNEQAQKVLGEAYKKIDSGKIDANRLVSHRLSLLAHAAWKQELMSESQLSELLGVTTIQLREVVDDIELEGSNSIDLLKFPK